MNLERAPLSVLLPDLPDCVDAFFADSRDFAQTSRSVFYHVQSGGSECGNNRLGVLAAEPFDHAGREIFDDPLRRNGKSEIVGEDAELASVLLMDFPAADRLDTLSRGDAGQRADRIVKFAESVADDHDGVGSLLVFVENLFDLAAQGLFGHAAGFRRQFERRILYRQQIIHDASDQW